MTDPTTEHRTLEGAWGAFARNPDEATFAPIYDATRGIALAVCRRVLHDEEDALDAFQATYARLILEARNRPKELASATGAGPVPRLAGLEANALRKRRARASRRFGFRIAEASPARRGDPMHETRREFVETGPGPAEVAAERERREKMEAIVSSLGERDRVVIQLRYFDGMSLEDVARAMGMPLASVSSRIRRALRKLEGPIREAGLGDAATALGATVVAGAGLAVGAKIASGSLATGSIASVASASATAPSASAVFAKAATAIASGSLEFSTTAGASSQPGFASSLLALLAGLFKSHPVVSTVVALTTLAAPPAVVLVTGPDDPGIVVAPPRPARTPDPGYVSGPPLPTMDEIVRASAARFAGVVGYEYEWESEETIPAEVLRDPRPPHVRLQDPIPETQYSAATDLVLRGAGRVLADEGRILEIEERERFLPGLPPGGSPAVRFFRERRRFDASGTTTIMRHDEAPESREYSDGGFAARRSALTSNPFSILPLEFSMQSAWGLMGPFGARFDTELAERWRPGGWKLDDGDLVLALEWTREPHVHELFVSLDPDAAFRTRSIRFSNLVWDFAYDPAAPLSALPATLEKSGQHVHPAILRIRSQRLLREGLDEIPGDDAFRFPPPGPGARILDSRDLGKDEYRWWDGVRYHVGDAGRFIPWPSDEPAPGPTGTFAEHPAFSEVFDLAAGEVERFAHPAAHPLPDAPGPEPTPAWIHPRFETEYTPLAFPAVAPLRVSLVSVQRREEYEMEDEWATFELRYPTAGAPIMGVELEDEWRARAHLRRGDWATWGEFSIQALAMTSGASPTARVKVAFRPGPPMQKPQPEPAMTTEPILQIVEGRASPEDREALHRYHRAAVPLLRRHGLRLLGTHLAPEGSHPREPLVYLLTSDSYEAARRGWIALLGDPEFVALRDRMNPRAQMLLASYNQPFFMPAHLRPILESPEAAGRIVFEIRRYFQGEKTVPLTSLLDTDWERAFESAGARVLRVVRPHRGGHGTVEVLLLHPDAAHARGVAERLEGDPRYAGPIERAKADGTLGFQDVRALVAER